MVAEQRVVADGAELARAGAELVRNAAHKAVAERGTCTIALSGGSTPRLMFQLLAAPPMRDEMPWTAIQVYWGDERCVGPDDAQSNFRMARETLLDKVPIPSDHIHRMRGEEPAAEAAAAYEAELRASFNVGEGELPHLDLVLLGMGPDGHTASLFPDTNAASITDRLVAAPYVPHLKAYRLTLTLPVLNAAREVLFLVGGADKAGTVRAVFDAMPGGDPAYPASLVHPQEGTLYWLLDKAAASMLG